MLSAKSSDVGTLFITKAKRYAKFEILISSELSDQDVEAYGFVLLVELAIDNPVSPVLSKLSRKILSRFPSWMKLFTDSVESATPELQLPQTVGGKFVTSLLSDVPDDFESKVNIFELDRFVSTSDEDQLAWIYYSSSVPAAHYSVRGDNVVLAKADSLEDLYDLPQDSYVYYHDLLRQQILTTKLFQTLTIDGVTYNQIPTLRWNWFDEFGARVGLQRLYLEDNANYKARILDVYKNKPGVSLDQFKKTLRRELDLWKAFGATPDSDYLGATPEVLEMTDIEMSTPWFDFSGKPLKKFRDLVTDINRKHPSNWGYVRWNEGYWDYAGVNAEGVGRVQAVFDDSTPLGQLYQPGVGDFSDANLVVQEPYESEINFEEKFKAFGFRKTGESDVFAPIKIFYDYYGTYVQDYYDNDKATVNIRYMLTMRPHGSYASSSIFYTDFTATPSNLHGPDHPASPEYSYFRIFDQDGFSNPEFIFKNLADDEPYNNPTATPATDRINYYYSTSAAATPLSGSDNFKLRFYGKEDFTSTIDSPVSLSTPYYINNGPNILVGSNKYNLYRGTFETRPKIPGTFYLNYENNFNSITDFELDKTFIKDTLLFPPGATPIYINIDNVQPFGFSIFETPSEDPYEGYGGLSSFNGPDSLIPASPNILAKFIQPNFATPNQHFGYINTVGSTVNYYFKSLKYPYNSEPGSIVFSTGLSSTPVYPFKLENFEKFTEMSTPIVKGSINPRGVVNSSLENGEENFSFNSDLVGRYALSYDTFGLNPEIDSITKIEIENNTDGVNFSTNKQYVYPNSLITILPIGQAITQDDFGNLGEIEVRADFVGVYKSFLNSGWYSFGENEYYIYSSPITETHTTPGFNLYLSSMPRQGAPVLVERLLATPSVLKQVAFYDEATPSRPSLKNFEFVRSNQSNNLYLGYENVYDVSVVDTYTGYTLLSNGFSESNVITVFSEATPAVSGRDYEVSYRVRDSFTLDTDYYNSTSNSYMARIDLDATPNQAYSYKITYESSITGDSTPLSLNVDPLELWDNEGFVYLSHSDYSFDTAIIKLKPQYVIDDQKDYMVLTINSLDINKNPKPFQTFEISGPYIEASPSIVTTDINGFAAVNITYSGTMPSATPSSYVNVSGVQNGSQYAHENSNTEGYESNQYFDIVTEYENRYRLKAQVLNKIIDADGFSENYIVGLLTDNGMPDANKVVYHRRGRTLHEVFEQSQYSEFVTTDEFGFFSIGPFTASDSSTPGYWFAAVESEHSTVNSQNPITLSGDIVYWYEKYNNLNYNFGEGTLFNPLVLYSGKVGMYSTPNFTIYYHDGQQATPYQSTPDWIPPKWYPIDRHEQYLMGLLGSSHDVVETYGSLMKDYEEE